MRSAAADGRASPGPRPLAESLSPHPLHLPAHRLFEDIADPADWEALASAEAKTNPRLWAHLGRLDLVPPERRVGGPGASLLMAPFVHVSPDRPGRFTDGTYGVFSVGDSEEVSIREVAHHHARFMAATSEAPGWTSQFRMLVTKLDLDLHDLRPREDCHRPDDYAPSQALGRSLRQAGSNGVLYRSVRSPAANAPASSGPTSSRPRPGRPLRFPLGRHPRRPHPQLQHRKIFAL